MQDKLHVRDLNACHNDKDKHALLMLLTIMSIECVLDLKCLKFKMFKMFKIACHISENGSCSTDAAEISFYG